MYSQESRDIINKIVVIYEKMEKDIDKYKSLKNKNQIEFLNSKNNLTTNRLELETLLDKLSRICLYGKTSKDYILKIITVSHEMIEKSKNI